jgi:glutathione S-transferase
MTDITLYTAQRCPFAARARIALAEKGLPYETIEVDLSDRPAFMFEKNPTGTVPVLEEDNGFILPESRVIIEYLEDRFPEPALFPPDAQERAEVRYAFERFDAFSTPMYRARRDEEGAVDEFNEQLAKLDGLLAEHDYIVGNEFTAADIAYVPWVLRAELYGFEPRSYEHLAAWLDRLAQRPSIAEEMETVHALAAAR